MIKTDSIQTLQIAARGLVALLIERDQARLNSFFPAGFDPKTIQNITDNMTPDDFSVKISEVAGLLDFFDAPPHQGAYVEDLQNLIALKEAFESFTMSLIDLLDEADLSALLRTLDVIMNYLGRRIEATRAI